MGKQEGGKQGGKQIKRKQGGNMGDKKYTGKEELRGNYFKVADPDAYNKTVKAIIEYVQTTYPSSEAICQLLETQEEVEFPPPTQPVDAQGNPIPEENMTFVQKEQLRSEFKKRDRAEDHYNDNKIQVAGLLLGQC